MWTLEGPKVTYLGAVLVCIDAFEAPLGRIGVRMGHTAELARLAEDVFPIHA